MKLTETRTEGGITITRIVECSDALLDRPAATFIREWMLQFMRGKRDGEAPPKGVRVA